MEEYVIKEITSVGNWTLLGNSRKQCGIHASECATQGVRKIRYYHCDQYCCPVLVEAAFRIRCDTEWALASRESLR